MRRGNIAAALVLLASVAHGAGGKLTAHIGCAGGLGSERACAGDTITCVNTSKSDRPNRLTALEVGYTEADGTFEPPVDVLTGALGAFFRFPLADTRPFFVQEAAPDQELDVVYLINTEPADVGPFVIEAETFGEVQYEANGAPNWLGYSASYALRVALADCSGLSAFARAQVAQVRPRVRHFHKMRVHRQRRR